MKNFCCWGLSLAVFVAVDVFSQPPEKPDFSNADGRHWVVMVTQPMCSYCTRLENFVLQPLRASGLYSNKVRFTAVDLSEGYITDFDSNRIKSDDFASRYQGYGTPTLLFLSESGDVLAPAMFGVPDAIDYYGYEIEKVISKLP